MFDSFRVCIGGLPGIGSVGKVAADYLSIALNTENVKSIYSSGFPAQVMLVDGQAKLFTADISAPEDRDDLLLLTGDAQPLDVNSMYSTAGDILEAAKSLGATHIMTLAAYVGDSKEMVVGVATDPELARELDKEGVPLLGSGFIGGLNGILVGLAPLYDLQGVCLLGSTSGNLPIDLAAARNLANAVKGLLELDISLEDLEIWAEANSEEEETVDTSRDSDFDMNYV